MENISERQQIDFENLRLKLKTNYIWNNLRIWQLLALALILSIVISNLYFSETIFILWLGTVIILEPTWNKISVRKAIGAIVNSIAVHDEELGFINGQNQIAVLKFAEILKFEMISGLKQRYAGNFLFQTKYIKRALTIRVDVSRRITLQIFTDDYSQFDKLKYVYDLIEERKANN